MGCNVALADDETSLCLRSTFANMRFENFLLSIHKTMVVNETKTMAKVFDFFWVHFVDCVTANDSFHQQISRVSGRWWYWCCKSQFSVKFIHIHAPNGDYRNKVSMRFVDYAHSTTHYTHVNKSEILVRFFCLTNPIYGILRTYWMYTVLCIASITILEFGKNIVFFIFLSFWHYNPFLLTQWHIFSMHSIDEGVFERWHLYWINWHSHQVIEWIILATSVWIVAWIFFVTW